MPLCDGQYQTVWVCITSSLITGRDCFTEGSLIISLLCIIGVFTIVNVFKVTVVAVWCYINEAEVN